MADVSALRAELKTLQATVAALTPVAPSNCRASSAFEGCATITWDRAAIGAAATVFIVGAVDAATGEVIDGLAREGGDAIGTVIAGDSRLVAGRALRFTVRAAHCRAGPRTSRREGVDDALFVAAGTTDEVKIGTASFGAVALNAPEVVAQDDAALCAMLRTPRGASHGVWSSSEHSSVLRMKHVRGLGLIDVPRLGTRVKARSAGLLSSMRSVTKTVRAMRTVLHFATLYCTPTVEELDNVCRRLSRGSGTDFGYHDSEGAITPKMVGALFRWRAASRARRNSNDSPSPMKIKRRPSGIDPNASIPMNGRTSQELERGHGFVGVSATTNRGSASLLAIATATPKSQQSLDTMGLLLALGADVNMPSSTGVPLHIASRNGDGEKVRQATRLADSAWARSTP